MPGMHETPLEITLKKEAVSVSMILLHPKKKTGITHDMVHQEQFGYEPVSVPQNLKPEETADSDMPIHY
eukprot:5771282-Amphidinium_carterae.1